jgi:acyl-CoA synthetase (NDP forming)
MIRRIVVLPIGIVIAVAGVVVVAQGGVKAKDPALQAAIEARQKAVDTRNAAEWSRATADEFFRVNVDGTLVSRAEQMKAIAATTNKPTPVTMDRIQMFGTDAAVTTQRSPNDAGTGMNRITLYWVRQAGAWKVAATVFTPSSGK